MIPSRRILPVLFGLCLLSWVAFGAGQQVLVTQETRDPLQKQKTRQLPEQVETDIVTREAYCRWAVSPPVLDGKLDDRCWQDAVAIGQFASYWDKEKTPRAGTTPTSCGMTRRSTTAAR